MDDTWMYITFGVLMAVLGTVAVVAVVVNQKKNKVGQVHVASDMVGGYRLQNLMMTGQTSQVWEVVEATSGRHFAMKFLLPEKLNDHEHRRMLFHEADVGMLLAHQNIIRIMKLVKDKSNPYFLME